MNKDEIQKTIEICEKLQISLNDDVKSDVDMLMTNFPYNVVKEFKEKLKEAWKEELSLIKEEFKKDNEHLSQSSWKEQLKVLKEEMGNQCRECNEGIRIRDYSKMLTSNPPQYPLTCNKCNDVTYEYIGDK